MAIYLTDVQDPSTLSSRAICQLRVPGSYDDFTAMRRLHQLRDHLNLDAKQAHAVMTQISAFFLTNKHNVWSTARTQKQFNMYVLRWMCRGLSIEQAMNKAVLDQAAKRKYFERKCNAKRKRRTTV